MLNTSVPKTKYACIGFGRRLANLYPNAIFLHHDPLQTRTLHSKWQNTVSSHVPRCSKLCFRIEGCQKSYFQGSTKKVSFESCKLNTHSVLSESHSKPALFLPTHTTQNKAYFSQKNGDQLKRCSEQLEQLKSLIKTLKKEIEKSESQEEKRCDISNEIKKGEADCPSTDNKFCENENEKTKCVESQEETNQSVETADHCEKGNGQKKTSNENDLSTNKISDCMQHANLSNGEKQKENCESKSKPEFEKHTSKCAEDNNNLCNEKKQKKSKRERNRGKKVTPSKTLEKIPAGDCQDALVKVRIAEECARSLKKNNEMLRKQLQTLKNSMAEKETDQCAQLEKAKQKAEEAVMKLTQENEKLRRDLKKVTKTQKPRTERNQKNNKKAKNRCDAQDLCKKLKVGRSEGPIKPIKLNGKNPSIKNKSEEKCLRAEKTQVKERQSNPDLDKCVERCSKNAEKQRIKEEIKAAKKKCLEQVKQKEKELKKGAKHEDDGAIGFLTAVCDKIQTMSKKKKRNKKEKEEKGKGC